MKVIIRKYIWINQFKLTNLKSSLQRANKEIEELKSRIEDLDKENKELKIKANKDLIKYTRNIP